MVVEFEIPIRTQSESNMREHHFAKARRVKAQREASAMFCGQWRDDLPPKPWRVTMIRYAPRMLDAGNLPASIKGVQDGLCDAFDTDDRWALHMWVYDQVQRRKAEGEPGVGVRVESIGGGV